MQIPHKLVHDAFERAIAAGLERGHAVACAVVDGSGRQIGVLRHDDALWVTPEIAFGKATLASAYRTNTGAMFDRLQRERPLYDTSVAASAAPTNGSSPKARLRSSSRSTARNDAWGRSASAAVSRPPWTRRSPTKSSPGSSRRCRITSHRPSNEATVRVLEGAQPASSRRTTEPRGRRIAARGPPVAVPRRRWGGGKAIGRRSQRRPAGQQGSNMMASKGAT